MTKKNKLFLFSILFLTLFASFSTAGKRYNSSKTESDSIFFLIYNLEISKAERELIKCRDNLDPLNYSLLTTDLIWWKTLTSNNKNDFEKLNQYLKENQYKLEKLKKRNLLEELVNLNYQIRLMSIKNQYLKMVKYYIQINSIIESMESTTITRDEQNIFEIYKAIFNISKSKFILTRSTLKNENIIILEKHQESSNIVNKTIACYFLAKIYSEIENSPTQALPYYNKLCKLYPNNKIIQNERDKIRH